MKTVAARCVVRELLRSAQDAAASSFGTRNTLPPGSAMRELLRSAQDAAASSFGTRNTLPPGSAMRELPRSAHDAAASSLGTRNTLPPRSVVRELLESRLPYETGVSHFHSAEHSGRQRHLQWNRDTGARVNQSGRPGGLLYAHA